MSPVTKAVTQASQRLRALADAFDGGESLVDVAARFRIPLSALHRVVRLKTRPDRPKTAVSIDTVTRAVILVREGKTVKEAAATLEVNGDTLRGSLTKRGFSVKSLRHPVRSRPDEVDMAILDYQQGISVAEICRQRKMASRTLYMHLRNRGISFRQRRKKFVSSTDS